MAKIIVPKSTGISRQEVFKILNAALAKTDAFVNNQCVYSMTQEIICDNTIDLRIEDRLEYVRQIDINDKEHFLVVFFYDRANDPVAIVSIYGSTPNDCPLYFRARFDVRTPNLVKLRVLNVSKPIDDWLSSIK